MFLELDSGIPRAEDLQQVTVIEDKTEIPKTAPDNQKIQKWLVKLYDAMMNADAELTEQILSLVIKFSSQDGSDSVSQYLIDFIIEYENQLTNVFVEASIKLAMKCSDDELFQITQIFTKLDSHLKNLGVLILETTIRYLVIFNNRLYPKVKDKTLTNMFSHYLKTISVDLDTDPVFKALYESDRNRFYELAIQSCKTFPELFVGNWKFIEMILCRIGPDEVFHKFDLDVQFPRMPRKQRISSLRTQTSTCLSIGIQLVIIISIICSVESFCCRNHSISECLCRRISVLMGIIRPNGL